MYLGNFAYTASAASTCSVIQFSISGLQAELDYLLQMCSVLHSRDKVLARDLACADHWAVVPFLGLYMADQGSFKAILDHPCEGGPVVFVLSSPPCSSHIPFNGQSISLPTQEGDTVGGWRGAAPRISCSELRWCRATSGGPAGAVHWGASPRRCRERGHPLQADTIAFHLLSPATPRAKLVQKLRDWFLLVKVRAGPWGIVLDCPKYSVAL